MPVLDKDFVASLDFTVRQIIYDALSEYEQNHYDTDDDEWQRTVNELLDLFGE